MSVLRSAVGGEVSGTAVWLLSLSTALPLVVRRLWPVPVFGFVLTAACVGPAAGAGPALFLATAYALYLVGTTRRRRPGPSVVLVAALCAAGATLITVSGGQGYQGGSMDVDGMTAAEINRLAAADGLTLEELSTRTGSLEDTFLELTGNGGSTTHV